MDDLEQKLNSILGNPEMMKQLFSMAQSIAPENTGKDSPPALPSTDTPTGIDMEAMGKLASIAAKARVDSNQQALLIALRPYLSQMRLEKLQNAMRAASLAKLATGFLGGKSPLFPFGG